MHGRTESNFNPFKAVPPHSYDNKLEWAPRNFTKYVNLVMGVCPECPNNTQRSADHLRRRHGLNVPDPQEVADRWQAEGLTKRSLKKQSHCELIRQFEEELKTYIHTIERFIISR